MRKLRHVRRLLEIDLSSHRSIGFFILTKDLQYNAPSEITPTFSAYYTYIVSIEKKKHRLSYRYVRFSWTPQMQCAYVTVCRDADQKLTVGSGCLNLLCTFPSGHWIRANIQCGHRKVVCLFKQETSEGARWPLWKRGGNPTTIHGNIDRQKHI